MTRSKTILISFLIASLLLFVTASAQNTQNAGGTNKIESLPKDLEIQLALSALPPHLRDSATVCVLNPIKDLKLPAKEPMDFMALFRGMVTMP